MAATFSKLEHQALDPEIIRLFESGISARKVAKQLALAHKTVRRILVANGIDPAKHAKRHIVRAERTKSGDGYIAVYDERHPHADVRGRVKEHIAVATRRLGRALRKGEVVHHINGIKTDNRKENLLICNHSWHIWLHRRLGDFLLEQLNKGMQLRAAEK